ncbi:MAG: Glu-tRNA(Gln) amidotransferase subunit GatE [Nitrososphaeria archaeon]
MSYDKVELKTGLEIHQQLDVGTKLFCDCPTIETDVAHTKILRRLRPTQSELGQIDPAALYEFKKKKFNVYLYNQTSACLVECDEEPPHPINMNAVKAAITVALALDSKVVRELHVMRKIVIDGSNTTGFQRTVLIALGGSLKVDGMDIPVQTISLEEDAARIIEEKENYRVFSLDRLGVPLVEIALAPTTVDPVTVERIALELGRLLRLTKLVARGLGTIRQDLNVSVHDFKPSEVKGVQRLDLIPKVIEYEAKRQDYLFKVSNELKAKGLTAEKAIGTYVDVTKLLEDVSSQIVKKALKEDKTIYAIKLVGFRGLLGREPFPDVRLGLELADVARAHGLGGVLHSDELPGYGISKEEVKRIERVLKVREDDGFYLVFASSDDEEALNAIRRRAIAFFEGPIPETRGPLADGRTKYSRPRPGAARMYPETDIPLIKVTDELINECMTRVPKPWIEVLNYYVTTYHLNEKLATQILDSNYLSLFEKACSETNLSPTFLAVSLTELIVSLTREGVDTSFLDDVRLLELFKLVDSGQVSKESVLDVMRYMCQNKVGSEAALKAMGIKAISEEVLRSIILRVIDSNIRLVEAQKERSFGALMGLVMREVRGKVDGKKVSTVLREEIKNRLESKR